MDEKRDTAQGVPDGQMEEVLDGATKSIRLYLERVHCADCVRDLIEGVVSKTPGVMGAHFEDEDLCLVVEGTPLVDEEALRTAILDLGYSFRDPATPPVRPSNLMNGVYIGVAVAVLVLIMYLLNRA